jgi:diaminopimelate epimerase
VRLTKHHGLGNDFLVLLDSDGTVDAGEAMARALCDRHRGVGADGLIHVGPGRDGADVTMLLRNADGGRAEMSGNGARCLGQAVAMARGVDALDLTVATDAGVRRVTVAPGDGARSVWASVDMGPTTLRPAGHAAAARAAEVDVGNPHLVLLSAEGPPGAELLAAGRSRPDLNVEVVWPGPEPGALTMRVWERGVGETLACGTGACAAALAAQEWGLAGAVVTVHMPGGDARVERGDTVTLAGPSVYIATVEVPWP